MYLTKKRNNKEKVNIWKKEKENKYIKYVFIKKKKKSNLILWHISIIFEVWNLLPLK